MQVIVLHNVPTAGSAADQDVLVQCTAVSQALRQLGYQVESLSCTLDLAAVRAELERLRPQLIFNLVESLGGTDRLMAAATLLLESMPIPFTGSGTEAVLISGDKRRGKQALQAAGLPTPAWLDDHSSSAARDTWDRQLRAEASPTSRAGAADPPLMLVKPACEHASAGLDDSSVIPARPADDTCDLLRQRRTTTGWPQLAERFVDGREFNLSLLTSGSSRSGIESSAGTAPQVLAPAEIVFADFPPHKPRIVGHAAKWDESSFEYHHTPRRFEFPAADQALLAQLTEFAARAWH